MPDVVCMDEIVVEFDAVTRGALRHVQLFEEQNVPRLSGRKDGIAALKMLGLPLSGLASLGCVRCWYTGSGLWGHAACRQVGLVFVESDHSMAAQAFEGFHF